VGREGSKFHERVYLDFIVDGRSLGQRLGVGTTRDLAGCIGWQADSLSWGEQEEQKLLEQLLLDRPSDLETGRTMLYVCPECGFDIGCGAITAVVEETNGLVVWRDFGFEMDPPTDEDEPPFDHEGFEEIGPIRFNKDQYRATILNPPPKEPAP
jgi:hypothetical protein